MHVIIVTNAWYPHLSGVLRVVESLSSQLDARDVGHTIIHPQSFPGFPLPGYSEIKISIPILFRKNIENLLAQHDDVAIHIMTEGPLGLTMRNYCVARGLKFTTSFHTHWHKYIQIHLKIPKRVTIGYIREFHAPAERVLIPSAETKAELEQYNFGNELVICKNGVDTKLFRPRERTLKAKRPLLLYVGRVSREKNIEDFLNAKTAGEKHIVGDGPYKEILMKRYPDAVFHGALQGNKLARMYAEADVFVFPSHTDTFGVVLLEALASGVPVAAYPSPGPRTIITKQSLGALNEDIEAAIEHALQTGDSAACVAYAQTYGWEAIADIFYDSLVPAGTPISTTQALTDHLLRIPREFYKLFTTAGYARTLLFGLDKKE